MTVRDATETDLPAIRALVEQNSTAAQWTEQHYRELAARDVSRVTLVAEENNTVLGFVVALAATDEWEIENIVVAESRRRRGVAEELLRTLLERARKSRAARVFLDVRASNAAARALYGKLG